MSDDLLSIFWVEVGEYLETLNNQLLQIEMVEDHSAPDYRNAVRELNRVAHSMKGAARAVGITTIETISHYMEEVFAAAMNGSLPLTPAIADTLYDGLDLIQNVMDGSETNEEALVIVLAQLEQIVTGSVASDAEPPAASGSNGQASDAVMPDPGMMTREVPVTPLSPAVPDPVFSPTTSASSPKPTPEAPSGKRDTAEASLDNSTVVMRPVEETVRVTVSKLDRLMAEVTELFVARMHGEEQQRAVQALRGRITRWQREWRGVRASYIRLARRLQDQDDEMMEELQTLFRFLETNQRYLYDTNRHIAQLTQMLVQDNMRLSTLADQLQDDIGGMRLIPFESVVGAFQRMIRDLSRDLGKQINLEVEGAGVDIDKAVLDSLKEPILHLLRNAADHGIEMPEQRQQIGKPPLGRIVIQVQQRGSEIVINIADDGHGIDTDRVRRSIVRAGLMNEAEAAALNEEEVRTYIFHTGLSTSDAVTALSGRGMGMDIVRDRVESLRGRVSVSSVLGQGTTITIRVPVSLTRLRCIMLRLGDQQFAVPSAMVIRMDKVSRDVIFTAEGHDMIEVNERPLPLLSMAATLGVPGGSPSREGDDAEDKLSYLALHATDRTVAFEVDQLYSEQELVLKPLGPELARARFVSGASLLGTGEVIIVLDANDLVRRATGTAVPYRKVAMPELSAMTRRQRVLVVDDSITTRTLEKNILETAGFEVYVAIDGVEAWEMLAQHDFDVIISDVEMPNMNGLELTARIKSSTQYSHLPVVLLTSLAKPEHMEAGLHAGADTYLIKSQFDQGELLQTIQSLV